MLPFPVQPKVRDSWRYINIHVKTDTTWMNKLTGMCGNFNGGGSDDITDITQLTTSWLVSNMSSYITGATWLTALTPAVIVPPTPVVYVYSTSKTIDQFAFDPKCSGGSTDINTTVPYVLNVPSSDPRCYPPALASNFTPISPPKTIPSAIVAACKSIINSATSSATSSVVAQNQDACQDDMVLAGGYVPSTAEMAPFTDSFQSMLWVVWYNTRICHI